MLNIMLRTSLNMICDAYDTFDHGILGDLQSITHNYEGKEVHYRTGHLSLSETNQRFNIVVEHDTEHAVLVNFCVPDADGDYETARPGFNREHRIVKTDTDTNALYLTLMEKHGITRDNFDVYDMSKLEVINLLTGECYYISWEGQTDAYVVEVL